MSLCLSGSSKMALKLGHPQHLCGQMLTTSGMIFFWLFRNLGPAFCLISWPCTGQRRLGASLPGTEAVSLEIKVISHG